MLIVDFFPREQFRRVFGKIRRLKKGKDITDFVGSNTTVTVTQTPISFGRDDDADRASLFADEFILDADENGFRCFSLKVLEKLSISDQSFLICGSFYKNDQNGVVAIGHNFDEKFMLPPEKTSMISVQRVLERKSLNKNVSEYDSDDLFLLIKKYQAEIEQDIFMNTRNICKTAMASLILCYNKNIIPDYLIEK